MTARPHIESWIPDQSRDDAVHRVDVLCPMPDIAYNTCSTAIHSGQTDFDMQMTRPWFFHATAEIEEVEMSSDKPKPTIAPSPDGPYIVKALGNLKNSTGAKLETKPQMALCRCGGSANKPYCDGTHAKQGFSSEKLSDGSKDKRDTYTGAGITIHDNRGICAHAGRCTDGLAAVFRLGEEPWVHPGAADAEKIIETVRRCPSGALSYSVEGVEHRDQDREPAITVAENGPYVVTGGPDLVGESRGEGASTEHYTLCRCGGSKNKPFCDGTHWHIKFSDDKN
jgi:CDGSH-type Zn-finger protein